MISEWFKHIQTKLSSWFCVASRSISGRFWPTLASEEQANSSNIRLDADKKWQICDK